MLCKPRMANEVAAVAKVLNKKEIQQSKDAQASLDKEWDKLLKKGTWGNEKVKDATTDACAASIAKQVKQQLCCANPLAKVLVHTSLPCTGGCPWNNINKNSQGGQDRSEEHQKQLKFLLRKLDEFLDTIKDVFPHLSFELPTFCEYWKWTAVRSFVEKHELVKRLQLHGCQVGVTNQNEEPVKKGWTIASNIMPTVTCTKCSMHVLAGSHSCHMRYCQQAMISE